METPITQQVREQLGRETIAVEVMVGGRMRSVTLTQEQGKSIANGDGLLVVDPISGLASVQNAYE